MKTPITFRRVRLNTKLVAIERKHNDEDSGIFREKPSMESNYPHCLFYDYYPFCFLLNSPGGTRSRHLRSPTGALRIHADMTASRLTPPSITGLTFFNKGFPTCAIIKLCLAYSIPVRVHSGIDYRLTLDPISFKSILNNKIHALGAL